MIAFRQQDTPAVSFHVPDMTCSRSVSLVTKAVMALDNSARVRIDLTSHRVDIQAARAEARDLREAIQNAGYTPEAPDQKAL